MASYFRQVPNFDYISRLENAKISDYIPVKNLFKRGKLREDIIENLAFFEKYSIIGDERPDNVAYKIYGDETLDWVILLSNNILNIQSEWPLTQRQFDKVMLEKYGSYEKLYSGVHHYETQEIKNSLGITVLPGGIEQPTDNTSFEVIDRASIQSLFVLETTKKELDDEGKEIDAPIKKLFVTLKTPVSNISLNSEVLIEGTSENTYDGKFTIMEYITINGSAPSYLDLLNIIDPEIGSIYETNLPDKQLWIYSGTQWFSMGPSFYENNLIVSSYIIEIEGKNNTLKLNPISLENSSILSRISSLEYFRFYDYGLEQDVQIPKTDYLIPVTNYEYELKIEEEKRNIFILKPRYLSVIFNDLEELMTYKKGSTQYVSDTLKRGDNIRLYT